MARTKKLGIRAQINHEFLEAQKAAKAAKSSPRPVTMQAEPIMRGWADSDGTFRVHVEIAGHGCATVREAELAIKARLESWPELLQGAKLLLAHLETTNQAASIGEMALGSPGACILRAAITRAEPARGRGSLP